MERVTQAQLESLVLRLNKLTKNNPTPWTQDKQGNLKANIGNYHLDAAYSGWTLAQMHNEGGGISHPISSGFVSKREIYNLISAYIKGIEAAI